VPQDEDSPAADSDVPQKEVKAAAVTEGPHDQAGTRSRSWLRLQGQQHGQHHEDTELAALVKDWVEDKWPGDNIKRTFVETELEGKIASYRKQARAWRGAQIFTWLLLAGLGLLISVFAGLKSGHGFTIIAGALVATLTTLTNATHPSKQADGYLTARLALRDEGWDLLNGMSDYASLDDEGRYEHFLEAVHKIVVTKRTSTNLDSLTA
jgi:hypothetical protein